MTYEIQITFCSYRKIQYPYTVDHWLTSREGGYESALRPASTVLFSTALGLVLLFSELMPFEVRLQQLNTHFGGVEVLLFSIKPSQSALRRSPFTSDRLTDSVYSMDWDMKTCSRWGERCERCRLATFGQQLWWGRVNVENKTRGRFVGQGSLWFCAFRWQSECGNVLVW